jgi:AbiV family abortive infection protein
VTAKGTSADVFLRVEVNVPAHRGLLSPRDLGRGILAAHRNARRLFRDAVLLLENGRYPGAVSMAILAHEEKSKSFTVGVIASELQVPPSLFSPWKDFSHHAHKNATTLELARMDEGMAESYVRCRERCTYVDCVQGPERWSLPEAVLGREEALVLLRTIRKALQRILTATQLARLQGANEIAADVCSPEALRALREWSETEEAAELSRLDLEEQREWNAETHTALVRFAGEAGPAT